MKEKARVWTREELEQQRDEVLIYFNIHKVDDFLQNSPCSKRDQGKTTYDLHLEAKGVIDRLIENYLENEGFQSIRSSTGWTASIEYDEETVNRYLRLEYAYSPTCESVPYDSIKKYENKEIK